MSNFNIGIVGYWFATNYGSVITYYALSHTINDLGYSTVLIDRPEKECDPEGEDVISRNFLKKHCSISESVSWDNLNVINDLCDGFVIGSDQVWTSSAIRIMRYMFFLSFADDSKKKIAYSSSFGSKNFLKLTDEQELKVNEYLRRFDQISVRENEGMDILKKEFGIKAERTLDPVFLISTEDYDRISLDSDTETGEDYILAYILDPDPDKERLIKNVSKKLSKKVKIILDGREGTFSKNRAKFSFYGDNEIMKNVIVEDWIKLFKNAVFVITDSHHGLAMAVIYNKQFICYANHSRGYARFVSLMAVLGIPERMIENSAQADKLLEININFAEVNKRLDAERKRSIGWLKAALETPKTDQRVGQLHANPDFIKIRILATLLRDYGIKHIILSPGGRDVPIVRMFEYNEDKFVLHRVTDERSAAYFGMGIAAQLRQPVVCVCTSGTAASNYLPAVTEAYYTGIPLIVVTADRQQVYLNHGEDQTIPQRHIYDGVVKKSVTVPEGSGYKVEYQTRRDISDCILESTHNGFGPVHINIAIDNIAVGANAPRKSWELLPKIYPHILRVGFNDGEIEMMKWVEALKKSQKILIVYGQNPRPTKKQLKYTEAFASKFNCVIVTDCLANLDCAYSLKPHNMLNAISGDNFIQQLAPDILITVGGKRLMNDPLTFKIRGGPRNIRHWSVTPDGKIKDFYFRLTSVIEMSQDRFFEWFSDHAGDIRNNGVYYNAWKNLCDKYSTPLIQNFNAPYVNSKFIPLIPQNSILHLGVGLSFVDCRRYPMNKEVEVFCNMGTNGIDGCTSTFMGQCSVVNDRLCFLLVGDLSFFYDMNSIWNKELKKNIRILMVNNNGSGLLRGNNLKGISSVHNTSAKGWVESTGFEYITANTPEEYEEKLKYFVSDIPEKAVFFEVFCD